MRAWIATACLAASWLFGLGYFGSPHYPAWLCTLATGVLLAADVRFRLPGRRVRGIALLLLLPAVWSVPLPYNSMPTLLFGGIALSLVPLPSLWPRRLARGAVLASAILLPQSLVLLTYQLATARAHELPGTLAAAVAMVARLLGLEACLDGTTLVLRNALVTCRVAATWELLLDPATVCFVVGAATLIMIGRAKTLRAREWKSLAGSLLALLLVTLAWVPLRTALLIALVVHQQLRADVMAYPNVGEILVSSWMHVGLVLALSLLTGGIVRRTFVASSIVTAASLRPAHRSVSWRRSMALPLFGLSLAVATFFYDWAPVGEPKSGRVMMMERHSTWEPTTVPYGTEVYGEAGSYNYAAIYEYSSQFYQMSRLLDTDSIDDSLRTKCDVLVIKTPTSRYSPEEVSAVVRFVEQGGSLLMIGDHTNVFNMNTYLNDISRHFGFTFRNDLLFRIGDPYRQSYEPPKIAHPILQFVPPMYFAVSCSVDPGWNSGTMVIRNTGLWNLPPAYQESNYHPQAEYRPNMQYGAWCQLWSTVHGRGRVLAFADSTLFSNFCTYQPGKAELFVGMIEWLNHSSRFDSVAMQGLLRLVMIVAGLSAFVLAVFVIRRAQGTWVILIAVGWISWTVATLMVDYCHRRSMPVPGKQRTMTHVVVDRTVSTVPLFTGAFADDPEGGGYGMLEQWIPRIGNYISRRSGSEVFQGDGVVVMIPTELPSQQYRDKLIEWVRGGGRLVVFDTPDVEESTANSLLMLFGLTSIHNAPEQQDEPLRLADGSLETPLQMSCEIRGGEPIALWGQIPVAARIDFGSGAVTAIGFGSLFNDANMGYHWLPEPDRELLRRYDVLYALLRAGLP